MQSLFCYFCITFLSVGAVCLDGHAYTISAAFFPVQKSYFEVVNDTLYRWYTCTSQKIQCSATVWCCDWWWFCRKYHKYMCLLLVYQTNHQLSWYIQHTPPKWILFVGKGKHYYSRWEVCRRHTLQTAAATPRIQIHCLLFEFPLCKCFTQSILLDNKQCW